MYHSLNPSPLQSFYGRSRRRLLVFDYDGTLVAHHALAQLSAPPPVLLQVLEALCEVRQFSSQTCHQVPHGQILTSPHMIEHRQHRFEFDFVLSNVVRPLSTCACRTQRMWCTLFRAGESQSWRTGWEVCQGWYRARTFSTCFFHF